MSDRLFPSEMLVESSDVPMIAYVREGSPERPIVVALPGGGHLARIFYGHPGGQAENFLDHWLDTLGFGLIALSYPSDHPAFRRRRPDLTVTEWGCAAAEIAAGIIRDRGLQGRVVLAGWSMAGRVCRAFNVAAHRRGLNTIGFIALAATPPLPGMTYIAPKGEPSTAEGFWRTGDRSAPLSARSKAFLRDVHWQRCEEHPEIISEAAYANYYIVNTPIRLRGEPDQWPGLARNSLLDTITDLGTFDYADYPFTGVIAPTRASDARHVLTDQATWAFLNSQKLFSAYSAHGADKEIGDEAWAKMRNLAMQLPIRLSRHVEGGHFFFVGRDGAAQTALHIADLSKQIEGVKLALARLLCSNSSEPQLDGTFSFLTEFSEEPS